MPFFGLSPLRFLGGAARRLGPVFWVDLGFGNRALLLADEEGFEVFRNQALDSSHMANVSVLLGRSMLTIDGADHRRVRGVSGPVFTPGGLTRAKVGEVITETCLRQLATWRGRERVKVVLETKAVALDVIFRVMGIDVAELAEWGRHYNEFILGGIVSPRWLPGSPAWRGARARRWLEARIAGIIARVRASGDRESIVGTMVHGRDESGAGMTEQELIDNLLILALAGHETTASTLAWSMIHLANAPAAWERLVAEATAMDEVPSDWSALAERVPFALGVFRESLRLYPPVHVDSRRTHAPVELAGYTIPERTVVAASILLMSRDPERYPEPEAWRPERWGDRGRKPTAIENCQFGGGAHFCLGYHMALLEGTLFLVHAARELAAAGRRPELIGGIPRPRYMPVTRPPAGVEIALV
ncbi:MAG: cytochrome P450 [Myxococcales bacterium]|nr:cytochrome P450 [Myxococcales bacterium]MCB9700767.1 cytochrome P450 [Myxococcales bacterium]